MPHDDATLFRLDVNVARARADTLREEIIDQARHAGAIVAIVDGRWRRLDVGRQMLDLELLRRKLLVAIRLIECACQRQRARERKPDRPSRGKLDRALAVQVQRVGGRNLERAVGGPDRKHAVAPSPALRQERAGVRTTVAQIGYREPELLGGKTQ